MKPFARLHGLAEGGRLTLEDVVAVRTFFEELPRRPNARFRRL
jgi:hypothetical protein